MYILQYMYCKTLIFRVTLFSRAHDFGLIHETLFSRLFIYCFIILTREILAWTLFSRVSGLANLGENKVLMNKKCFTVYTYERCMLYMVYLLHLHRERFVSCLSGWLLSNGFDVCASPSLHCLQTPRINVFKIQGCYKVVEPVWSSNWINHAWMF